ncbi:MAG: AraC family transcriptional regulator [Mycobacteriales bacterium]
MREPLRGQRLDSFGQVDWSAPRSAASVLLLARLGQERGVGSDVTLAGTGLTLSGLRVPGAEVTGTQELAVLRNLQAACPDPALPLVAGARYHLTTYGIWGFALASSPTVRSALDVGARFVDLSFTFCALALEEDAEQLSIYLDDAQVPADVRPFVVARDLAGLRTIVAELTQSAVPLRSLAVTLPRPVDVTPWIELFGREPEFGAARNRAALDVAFLALPLPQADELTAAATEAQCRELVQRRRARSATAGRVRDVLLTAPASMPSVEVTAAALHVSARTLRRRLGAEGTSYRGLVEEVREALAEELLRAGLPVEQVSRRLGYAEPASFTHAFTRWKGVSPRAWSR